MTKSSKAVVTGILRNSTALMVIGVFGKAMGLVIAVFIARFLGPAATGLFALLFSVAILVESLVAVGLQDTLVREVASRPLAQRTLFATALKLVLPTSALASAGYLVTTLVASDFEDARRSLLVLAIGTPIAAVFTVSQAILQGAERISLLTGVILGTRVASIAVLAAMLWFGAGVEAAFISRLLFHIVSGAVFSILILHVPRPDAKPERTGELFRRSIPFALNRATFDLGSRAPVLVMPSLLGLMLTGIFDAADRFRHTLGMAISSGMTGLMPAFARAFGDTSANNDRLLGFSAKYACLIISGVATVVSIGASFIVELLYGQAFLDAAKPMQILVWSHVLWATDAVFKQAMLATRNEYSVVTRSSAGLLLQLPLIVGLGYLFGVLGVCVGIFIATAFVLVLDIRYVVGKVAPLLQIGRFVARPLIGALIVGAALFTIHERELLTRFLAALLLWSVVIFVLRLLPKDEVHFLRDMFGSVFRKLRKTGKPPGGDAP